MDKVILNNGLEMPLLGLGVYQVTDLDVCEQSVACALQTGYRMIDTAACYGNERAVGSAVKASGIKREDIFICSKVWVQDAGYDRTMKSFEKTLQNLQTDYLDLYLVHMPFGDYHGSWRAMEELCRLGKVKAIGVCNFLPDRLADLIRTHEVVPAVNQVELHPLCQRRELRKFMESYQIYPMAWAPFVQGQRAIFERKELIEIGEKHGKTPAQVILRWLGQSDIITIPKSVHAERIRQNFDIEDFELDAADMQKIEKMDEGKSVILDIQSIDEVYRLHDFRFEQ